MIKLNKNDLCFLISFFLTSSMCCYGKETVTEAIDIKDFPKYFTVDVWEKIKQANEQIEQVGIEDEKVIAIMDSPVEYISGLAGKMKKKEKQRGESFLVNPYHGTAVAGLIASEPCKLPCYFEKNYTSRLCDKAELIISGIARHVRLSSFLARKQPSDLEDSIEKLVSKADPLTDDEKKTS